jgi:hypothetical protein
MRILANNETLTWGIYTKPSNSVYILKNLYQLDVIDSKMGLSTWMSREFTDVRIILHLVSFGYSSKMLLEANFKLQN